jgi:hypothetical protein
VPLISSRSSSGERLHPPSGGPLQLPLESVPPARLITESVSQPIGACVDFIRPLCSLPLHFWLHRGAFPSEISRIRGASRQRAPNPHEEQKAHISRLSNDSCVVLCHLVQPAGSLSSRRAGANSSHSLPLLAMQPVPRTESEVIAARNYSYRLHCVSEQRPLCCGMRRMRAVLKPQAFRSPTEC